MTSELEKARLAEVQVYIDRYADGKARKGTLKASTGRLNMAWEAVKHWEGTGLVDIGCGTPRFTYKMRRDKDGKVEEPLRGVEPIPNLARDWAHQGVVLGSADSIPFGDNSFDFATCFDCIEHLAPGDEILCFNEMKRVARKSIAFSIHLGPSTAQWKGKGLHINIRPQYWWDEVINDIFPHTKITNPKSTPMSPLWIINLNKEK